MPCGAPGYTLPPLSQQCDPAKSLSLSVRRGSCLYCPRRAHTARELQPCCSCGAAASVYHDVAECGQSWSAYDTMRLLSAAVPLVFIAEPRCPFPRCISYLRRVLPAYPVANSGSTRMCRSGRFPPRPCSASGWASGSPRWTPRAPSGASLKARRMLAGVPTLSSGKPALSSLTRMATT